jgi:tetratricopeptide (TPR) repeat protein
MSLQVAKTLGYLRLAEAASGNLGNTYIELKEYDRGIEYLEYALTLAKDLGNLQGQGNHLSNLGAVYDRMGMHDKAVAFGKKSLKIRNETLGEDHPLTLQTKRNIEISERKSKSKSS